VLIVDTGLIRSWVAALEAAARDHAKGDARHGESGKAHTPLDPAGCRVSWFRH